MGERVISKGFLSAFIISSIIGTGIYAKASDILIEIGSIQGLFYVYAIAGLIAFCGSNIYARIGSVYPVNGGEYNLFLQINPFIAFAFASTRVLSLCIASAAILNLGIQFLKSILTLNSTFQIAVLKIGTLILIYLIANSKTKFNVKGVSIYFILKIILLISVCSVALYQSNDITNKAILQTNEINMSPQNWSNALASALWSYNGWHLSILIAGEVKNPKKSYRTSLMLSIAFIVIAYLLVNYSFSVSLSMTEIINAKNDKTVAGILFEKYLPASFSYLLIIAFYISCAGTVNIALFGGIRLLWRWIDSTLSVNKKKIPHKYKSRASISMLMITMIISLTATFEYLSLLYIFIMYSFYLLATISFWIAHDKKALAMESNKILTLLTYIFFVISSCFVLVFVSFQKPYVLLLFSILMVLTVLTRRIVMRKI